MSEPPQPPEGGSTTEARPEQTKPQSSVGMLAGMGAGLAIGGAIMRGTRDEYGFVVSLLIGAVVAGVIALAVGYPIHYLMARRRG